MNAKPWWTDAVIYQVYPRSFQDSGGDGIGDLRGIIARADYFTWLGVDAVWFSPFFTSPQADFGYDVSDYTDIDPSFGTLADFDAMVAALHQRGIRVILDYVPNHTSNRHPWFQASRSSRADPKRDWYIWRDPAPGGGPPNNWQSLAGGPSWEFDEGTGQYYCHTFLKEQCDLNWRNPEVVAAMHEVLRFWLDRGVDGFRVDAVGCLAKDPALRDDPPNPAYKAGDAPFAKNLMVNSANGADVIDFIAGMRAVADPYQQHPVLIGEVYVKAAAIAAYYGSPALAGLQLPTNFALLFAPWKPVPIRQAIEAYEAALPAFAWPDWVLGNHDQSRVATRIGAAQARAAMTLLVTLRGTPILYAGDELGLPDVAVPPDRLRDPFGLNMPGKGQGRDPERCPMPWDGTAKGGFTTGDPWLPVGPYGPGMSVAAQRADAGSILHMTRALIALRRREPALSRGSWSAITVEGEALAYAREGEGRRFAVVLNLDGTAKTVRLPGVNAGRVVFSTHGGAERDIAGGAVALGPDEGLIIRA